MLVSAATYAQQSKLRLRWVHVHNGTLVSDSLTIDPASLRVEYPENSSVKATFYPDGNGLWIQPDTSLPDSIQISYRTFPFNLGKRVFNRNVAAYDSSKYFRDPIKRGQGYYEQKEELFTTPGLNKTGSISRGVSFGNNQDVFVNSALNLQMEGKLSPDISILAAISDQNIPIQADGNTQNLQQFDRVYIQISGKGASLTAGDVVLRNKESYFLKYLKNVQGGFAETNYSPTKDSKATTSAGAAISKGKFNSMFLEATEGLQGPYKLQGPNNERFIIVISGSEKVYLDGRLLTRGFNYDYVIDYNQAQVTFTNQILITRYSRIRVDFEFSDKNFARTTMVASHSQSYKNLNAYLSIYSEKDNPNSPITAELSASDVDILKRIGDTVSQAYAPGATSVAFSPSLVLYKKKDTVLSAIPIYVYTATDPGTEVFQLSFVDMGVGNGHYNQITSTANGRVFEWAATLNGVLQGRYEPLKPLPMPTKKQMYTAGFSYKLSEKEKVYSEVAVSDHSQNLLSTVNSSDDVGKAVKAGYSATGKNIGLGDYKLNGNLDYEYLDQYFRPIDRFRSIEFDRDWGTTQYTNWSTALAQTAEDHLISASLGIAKDKNNQLNYRFSFRKKEGFVNGNQQQISLSKQLGNYFNKTEYFLMHNDQPFTRSDWQRLSIDNSVKFKRFTPGYRYSFDRNTINGGLNKDSVIASAMYFEEHAVYLKNNDSAKVHYASEYSFRKDNAPFKGEIASWPLTESKTWTNSAGWKPNENNNLGFLFTYRSLTNKRDTINSKSEETIMGRVDWSSDLLLRHIRSELTYTAQTGRQQVNEYVYIEVPAGQGQFKWVDYNNDGVRQLNEFVEAINFDEKTFIRFFTPTDRFVKAYTNSVNYRINLIAPRKWRDKGKLKNTLSRFSNTTAWTAERKTLDESLPARFVPLYKGVAPADVLSATNNLRSTLFFNRTSPAFGIDFIYINTRQQTYLFNGTENRSNLEYQLNNRVNVRSLFNVKLNLIQGTRGIASDYLQNRNYTIQKQELNPELAFQPTERIRLTGSFQYIPKRNIHPEGNNEKATFKNLGLETRINQVNTRTVTASVKYIHIQFENGEIDSPLGYDMLESLRPGDNFTWLSTVQQKLASGLTISINYEGRKAQAQRTVHIGRVQVSAVF